MGLHQIRMPKGANSSPKRVGRGVGSGMDKTCGRGHKGSNARSGPGMYLGFEGGQMPLIRRLPKRGFNNKAFAQSYSIVNVGSLNNFAPNTEVTPALLEEKGLVKKKQKIKLLGNGQLSVALKIRVHKASSSAIEKVKRAGGEVILI